jgi:NitT/TauT family transport system ATP-binding protein
VTPSLVLSIAHLIKSYPKALKSNRRKEATTHSRTIVLNGINLDLEDGSFVSILGRSGSGKSTLLNLIMGLEQPDAGTIHLKEGTQVGMVFQQPALLPWKTVLANAALPLALSGWGKRERLAKAEHALLQVGLEKAKRLYPHQLSGGMAQRLAIARALVQDPHLFLMDEPFSALDPLLRENLNINLLKLWSKEKKSVLFVTHSINEAVLLSDLVLILEEGRFLQSFPIPLPRPRTFETPHDVRFLELVRSIHSCLPPQPNQMVEDS